MNKVLAKRLRELREKRGLTQTELGKLFNLSKQAISSYETGVSEPPPDTLHGIADFFNVSTDYLLGRTDDPRPGKSNFEEEFPEIVKVLRRGGRKLTPADKRRIARIIEVAIEDRED